MIVGIIGPYGRRNGASRKVIRENVKTAEQAALAVIWARDTPLCPHLYHYLMLRSVADISEDIWLEKCLELVPLMDEVVRLPGESVGADKEEERARLFGKKVYHGLGEYLKTRPCIRGAE